jgi:hypothetical protein
VVTPSTSTALAGQGRTPPAESRGPWGAWRITLAVLLAPVLLLVVLWTALAIHYTAPLPRAVATVLAWVVGVGVPLALVVLPRRRRTLAVFGALFLATAAWFWSIEPSNDRVWRTEVAVLPAVDFDGDRVTVRGIRDFAWRGAEEAQPRYRDRTFDLRNLRAVDLVVSYWDNQEDVAHTMLSWDFGGEDVLCLSVEVRREAGEGWGGLPGMFKQFEITYVLAEERDVIGVRARYRDEDVYLFRTAMTPADARRLLERILHHVNRLRTDPEFYRTIARNCTTAVVEHINAIWPDRTPYTRKILMNGYAPEQGYERGVLRSDLPFADYKRSARITELARTAGEAEDFSRQIRANLPAR